MIIKSMKLVNVDNNESTLLMESGKISILTGTNYQSINKLSSRNVKNYSYQYNTGEFVPQNMEFEVVNFEKKMKDFKKQLRLFNRDFIVEITKASGEIIFFNAKFLSEEIDLYWNASMCKMSFTIIRQSHFIKLNHFVFDLDFNGVVDDNGYDYTYDFEHSMGQSNTLEISTISLNNFGDMPAPFKIKIYGDANKPAFGINGSIKNTDGVVINNNGYEYESVLGSNEIIEVDSFAPKLKNIKSNVGNIVDIENDTNFMLKTYNSVPVGVFTIVLNNIKKCEGDIYEFYFNL